MKILQNIKICKSLLFLGLTSAVVLGLTTMDASGANRAARYRLYNPNNFHHHYTTGANEYSVLGTLGWVQEGVSCYLYDGTAQIGTSQTVPYYRLYNPNSYEHHWTTDANEYNVLGTIGWSKEGVDGYVFASQVRGSQPLYRLYNPNDGLHHWTMDANECSVLIGYGWVDEGIACYVFTYSGVATVTDESGHATLNLAGQDITFEFIDEAAGSAISGLSVGAALDPHNQGQGILMIIDPSNRYHPQIAILEGEEETDLYSVARSMMLPNTQAASSLVSIVLPEGPNTTIGRVVLGQLPPLVKKADNVLGLIDAVQLAAKVLNHAGIPLGEYAGKLGVAEQRYLTQQEAMDELKANVKDDIKTSLFFLVGSAGLTLPSTLKDTMIDLLTFGVDASTVLPCGLPGQKILVTSIDGLNFYDCKDVRLGDTTGLVYAAVDGFDNYGQPLSKGSLELLSKTNIGVGFRSILDGNGNATIEVPVDNYNAVVRSPGFVPGTQDILVSTQGATLNTSLSAPPPCTYTYSAWSACENDTQTRTVMSSYPDVCFGMPLLSQYCTDQNEMCCACYFDVYCDDFGPGGCWFCRTSTYNSEGECQAPYGYLTSPGPCFCRPELYQICLGSSG